MSMATEGRGMDILKLPSVGDTAAKTRIFVSMKALQDAVNSGMGILIECSCPAADIAITHSLDTSLRTGTSATPARLPGRIG